MRLQIYNKKMNSANFFKQNSSSFVAYLCVIC